MKEKFTLCRDISVATIVAGTSYNTQADNTSAINCGIIVKQIRVFGSLFDSTGAPKLSLTNFTFSTMQTQALPMITPIPVIPSVYFMYSEGVINGNWYVRAGTSLTARVTIYGALLATDTFRGGYVMNYELDM